MFAASPYCPPEIAELIQSGMLVPVMAPPNGSAVGNGPASPQSSGTRSQNGSSPSPPNGHQPRYQHYVPLAPLPFLHPMMRAQMGFPNEGPPQMRKLFIGGLSHDTTDDQLSVYFSQWGPVVDAIVIREPNTKQSRGFGFVTFATVYSAEAAIADRPHIIGGKNVDSKRAIPREQMTAMLPPPFFNCEPAPGCKLMLSGLHYEYHSVDCIRLYFEKFGSLDQVEILGAPRGIGFVVFEEKEAADKALAHSKGRHIINERKVEVRPWPKAPQHPPNSATYWRRPQPLIDQFAAMRMANEQEAHNRQLITPGCGDEDSSNYGGTTTEDDCKSTDGAGSGAEARDTDSPTSGSSDKSQ